MVSKALRASNHFNKAFPSFFQRYTSLLMFTSVELLYSNSFPRVFVLGSNVVQFSRSAAEVSLSQDLYCTTFLMRCQYISQIFFRYLSSFPASRPSPRDSLFILAYTSPTVNCFSDIFLHFPIFIRFLYK